MNIFIHIKFFILFEKGSRFIVLDINIQSHKLAIHFTRLMGKIEKKREGTHSGVADFDDEVGELEAIADGARGGGHVAREPVDNTAAGVEPHLSHPLPYPRRPTHHDSLSESIGRSPFDSVIRV